MGDTFHQNSEVGSGVHVSDITGKNPHYGVSLYGQHVPSIVGYCGVNDLKSVALLAEHSQVPSDIVEDRTDLVVGIQDPVSYYRMVFNGALWIPDPRGQREGFGAEILNLSYERPTEESVRILDQSRMSVDEIVEWIHFRAGDQLEKLRIKPLKVIGPGKVMSEVFDRLQKALRDPGNERERALQARMSERGMKLRHVHLDRLSPQLVKQAFLRDVEETHIPGTVKSLRERPTDSSLLCSAEDLERYGWGKTLWEQPFQKDQKKVVEEMIRTIFRTALESQGIHVFYGDTRVGKTAMMRRVGIKAFEKFREVLTGGRGYGTIFKFYTGENDLVGIQRNFGYGLKENAFPVVLFVDEINRGVSTNSNRFAELDSLVKSSPAHVTVIATANDLSGIPEDWHTHKVPGKNWSELKGKKQFDPLA